MDTIGIKMGEPIVTLDVQIQPDGSLELIITENRTGNYGSVKLEVGKQVDLTNKKDTCFMRVINHGPVKPPMSFRDIPDEFFNDEVTITPSVADGTLEVVQDNMYTTDKTVPCCYCSVGLNYKILRANNEAGQLYSCPNCGNKVSIIEIEADVFKIEPNHQV